MVRNLRPICVAPLRERPQEFNALQILNCSQDLQGVFSFIHKKICLIGVWQIV